MVGTTTRNDFYLSEKNYSESMETDVLPFLKEKKHSNYFEYKAHRIAYDIYLLDDFKSNIVISHGFAERKEKYEEAIYYFLKMGYQVFILDHFGHGESVVEEHDSSLIYIDEFNHYVNDLHYFITQIVSQYTEEKPLILYGHSMGGCIASLFAETFPGKIDGLILNAPMFSIKTGLPRAVGTGVTKLSVLIGSHMKYVVGFRPFNPMTDTEYNPEKIATSSKARGEYAHMRNIESSEQPAWGPSWKWLHESIKAAQNVTKEENVKEIGVPILLFQAENDLFVLPKGMREFAKYAEDIQFYLIGDAWHEIYLEKDAIVHPYFDKLNQFIDSITLNNLKTFKQNQTV